MSKTKRLICGLAIGAFTLAQTPTIAFADPPPWAPAHGWRAKQGDNHSKQRRDNDDTAYSGSIFGCNGDVLGSVVGGLAGAALGSQFGKGDGKTIAIISGAIVGVLAGGSIGRSVDVTNNNCISKTFETVPDSQPVVWQGQQDQTYSITPTNTFEVAPGAYCREYTSTATVSNQQQKVFGTACRQPDGTWKIIG
ncbi:MAG: glycine zipper 2TM domain-containing protein [Alphaproteobacteria bacterium]|nr:glycine zipper 2TM domain-containing protein [Alphaproteobacteria bacterium]